MRVADLCSGTGSATVFFKDYGHTVDCFDLPDGDITKLHFKPGEYDFIWASPPCDEYAKLVFPWFPVVECDLGLWEHCRRLILECRPMFYVIENSKGAQRIWGPADHRCGSFFFWGNLPIWPKGHYYKNINTIRNPVKRAKIPKGLASQFAFIVTKCMKSRQKILDFFDTPAPLLQVEPCKSVSGA